ncbi:hypothetical protein IWT25_01758 [Secundilactobacillus pentosiphilus]|uniref:MucBP domain-containing protein n=1 Tax=Secundilactobacillus pentosiphilus TaxID=1714682 RepID=A0A1Z5IXB0_9LACO|nr:MucBP domain-containing protein [Secundilactobacillus pentosiphilus]GAX06414.1 hypothetical protein IWT25_01758 [Secundilactobacillus pentosiphilus]
MSEAEETAHKTQNYAEVHFETKSGEAIMEPLKIFRAIDATYQVATPILKGYVLVKKPDELTRKMTDTPAVIRLVYDRIGALQVYHGLTDVAGELITLKNGDKPDQVAPVELQDIDGHHYYVMTDDGLGEQIADPAHYQPGKPNAKTNLVSLTPAEKDKVDKMETELTIDPDGKLPDMDDLQESAEEPEKALDASSESADEEDSSRLERANDDDHEAEASEQSDSQAASEQATPVALLAKALTLICDSMQEVDDPKKVDALVDSSQKMLEAIKSLTVLDGVKEE